MRTRILPLLAFPDRFSAPIKAVSVLSLILFGALSVSGAQLTLTWKDNSNNETGFKIERSLNGSTFGQIATVGANSVSYADTGLADSTRYYYRVRAYNAAGNSGYTNVSDAVTASVAPPLPPANTAPTLSSIANRTINEDGTTGAVAFTVTDQESSNGSLTLSATSSNTTLLPVSRITFGGSGTDRTVQATPASNRSGTATITVTVSDGQLTAARSFLLTVNAVNDTPTISSIAARTIPQGGSTGPISFTVGDMETSAGSLTLTRTSSNTGLIPLSGIVFGGSGGNRTVTVKPAATQSGIADVTVRVSDGAATASRTFRVTVEAAAPPPPPPPPANTAPTVSSIVNRTINEDGTTGAVAFTVTDQESSNGSLTLSATSSNTTLLPVSRITFGGSSTDRTVQATPASNRSGSATVTVTVSDGQLTAARSFLLTVNAVNDTPTISSIAARTIPQGGSTDPISFTVGDMETSAGSLTLTRTSSNTGLIPLSGIVFGGSGGNRTVTVKPAATQSGIADVTIRVSDGAATASRTFRVTVEAAAPPPPPPQVNTAPTVSSIANRTINEDGTTGAIAFTVTDQESSNGSLTLSATSSNTTLLPVSRITFGGSGSNRTVQAAPASNRSGTATVTVTVSDGQLTAARSFVLTVNPVNDAPSIGSIADRTIVQNGNTGSIGFSISDRETTAGSLVVSADSGNRTLVPLSGLVLAGTGGSRSITVTPARGVSGQATVTIRVSDGSLTVERAFRLTVTPLNAVTVHLTAPTNGATIASGSAIGFAAVVSDTARTARVEFHAGSTKLGQDTSHPYGYTWSAPSAGSHILKARVVDTDGNARDSVPVTVTVASMQPLTVSMKTPSADETINLGQSMGLEAVVAGPSASIQFVDFFVGTSHIRREFHPPYTATWKPANAGTYTLKARVTSTSGAGSDSPARRITVLPPAVTVTLISPVDSSIVAFGKPVSMEARVSSVAKTTRVEFFDGTTKIKTENYSPYLFNWTPPTAGTHSISAKVFDNAGNERVSGSAEIVVTSPSVELALTSPKSGVSLVAGTAVTLRASVLAPGTTIARVEFFRNGTKLGQDTSAPYALNWKPDTVGNQALRVRMVAADGKSYDSANVGVTVILPPVTVSLTTPVMGQTFPVGQSVGFAAAVSDASRVARVEFHSEDGKIGEDATAPYTLVWKPPAAGTFRYFARVIETSGDSRDSGVVSVTISGAPSVTVTMTSPKDRQSVLVGDSIRVSATIDVDPANVTQIDFYAGSTRIKVERVSPYDFLWTPTVAGEVTLRASALSTAGSRFQSDPITVTVANPPIVVEVTKPEAGSVLAMGERVEIAAVVSDLSRLDRVEFLINGEVVADGYSHPFSRVEAIDSVGDHTVRVKAITTDGEEVLSEPVAFTVESAPLTLRLVEPPNGVRLKVGDILRMEGEPSEPDRTSKVTFMIDGVVIGEALEAPYAIEWTVEGIGVREIQARVHDLEGNGSLSEVALVTVDPGQSLEPGLYLGIFVDPVDGSPKGEFALRVSGEQRVSFLGYTSTGNAGFMTDSVALLEGGRFEVTGVGDSGPVPLTATVGPESVEGQTEDSAINLLGSRILSEQDSGIYRLLGIGTMDTEVWLMTGGEAGSYAGVLSDGRFRGERVTATPVDPGYSITSSTLGIDVFVDSADGRAEGFIDSPEGGVWLSGSRLDRSVERRLENLSTRGVLLPGNSPMIVGFVIEGEGPKTVLLRAVGPGLTDFGVPNAAVDPTLLLRRDGVVLAENQRWYTSLDGPAILEAGARSGAFPLDPESVDAALLLEVDPGSYSAVVRDAAELGGDTLVEIYDVDVDDGSLSQLRSLSTRGPVGNGRDLIGGFVVMGDSPKRVLIRGVGPALSTFGVEDPLPAARLVLTQRIGGNEVTVGDNLGWSSQSGFELLAEVAARVGAFPLTGDSLDSALLLWLEPGVYTFLVQPGAPDQTGTALVEVYQTD